ncbi:MULTISPECIES: hypothetical protein [unclassified Microbacterium]|uniref:hypothetical protein n=1 Tax=unclassified Microbacterium TaxID=2609290 RepID=UPI0006FF68BB|nr:MULTISPECIES: hypothetical protein [unclassified Microbacterium]KQT72671.1 NADH:ubiquinone oxidoreductase [Microbacterium sp. Leaf436]MBD8218475.1 hypothetical protein [Microbacterium sp. CFBP 13617]
MRQYIFGTGLLSAITGGVTLLRALRNDEPFTWRVALAWLSWGITLALAVGSVVDTRRARRGKVIAGDSPVSKKQQKLLKKRLSR